MMFNNQPCVTLSLAISIALGTVSLSADADGLITDPRIRPQSQLQINSSDPQLDIAIDRSINYIYDYLVVGPQQFPTTEVEPRITKFREAGVDAVPSLWGSYHGTPTANAQGYRENFCLRDVAHQTEGAALLSLNEENFDMLHRFAFDALQSKRVQISDPNLDPLDPWASATPKSFWQEYWTLWSYNFYGAPYYMDAGFQELPAPLELLEKVYLMYEQTGDSRWLSDTFIDYGRQLHQQFAKRYDFNGNGIVDNRGNEGILPTLWEFEGASHIADDELIFNLSNDEQSGTLTIKQEYFARLGVQDMGLKVRFKNGKDDYLSVRINNLTNQQGQTPRLSHDYQFIENTQTVPDISVQLNIDETTTLSEVFDGETALTLGSDYTISGNTVIIKSTYLDAILRSQSYRYKFSFGFDFSDGISQRMVVEAGSRTHASDILDVSDITLDWHNLADVTLNLDFSQTPTENRQLYRVENAMNRVVEAGDTLGVQYQATLAFEKMLSAKAALTEPGATQDALQAEAERYQQQAAALLQDFRQRWYDDSKQTYARAFDGYGNAIFGWGHENSFFMPMKELLQPGTKADAYLQFIHDNSENLNEEAKTYLAEAFFNYGQNDRGWYWMQTGLERFYSNRTDEQMIKTYPEIAFTNVSNLITHMMGYQPKVHLGRIDTLSRLPESMEFVQVEQLPYGQQAMDINDYTRTIDNHISLKHQGEHSSTLSISNSNQPLLWRAQFNGAHPTLYIDGQAVPANTHTINGVEISYVELTVFSGQPYTVATTDGSTPPPVTPPNTGETKLTSLAPVSQHSDWGDININTSVDGNPLRVGGVIFSDGIGTHASSELVYDLAAHYQSFSGHVGVDDEVGGNGSVQFTILLDGQLAFDSGILSGGDTAVSFDLDVTGVSQLSLIASDGGDGINSDHANWLSPTLTPMDTVSLLSLSPTQIDTGWGTTQFNQSIDGNVLSIAGIEYEAGIGTHSHSEISYDLGSGYRQFSALVGVDDEVGSNGSIQFKVFLDGQLAYQSPLMFGGDVAQDIDLSVNGVNQLTLVATDGGDNINFDHANWGQPTLSK
ncbi:NPCBM/NEW2 domain-containing protein [Shewanella waksmanii]|uniref:NPCBM/NEW2 domain-containing protein n=1 Tax=Shewanella waksmanii TaxID=213783 RepID=UPI00373514DE